MKVNVKNSNTEAEQVWPQTPFLAYNVEKPNIILLVLAVNLYPIFLSGDASCEYPYRANETFAEKVKYHKHALFTGTVELENS